MWAFQKFINQEKKPNIRNTPLEERNKGKFHLIISRHKEGIKSEYKAIE